MWTFIREMQKTANKGHKKLRKNLIRKGVKMNLYNMLNYYRDTLRDGNQRVYGLPPRTEPNKWGSYIDLLTVVGRLASLLRKGTELVLKHFMQFNHFINNWDQGVLVRTVFAMFSIHEPFSWKDGMLKQSFSFLLHRH